MQGCIRGDHLTCEGEIGAQKQMMFGNTVQLRLELLEPVVEDWNYLVCFLKVLNITGLFITNYNTWYLRWLGRIYKKFSGDYGTLSFFRNRLCKGEIRNEDDEEHSDDSLL